MAELVQTVVWGLILLSSVAFVGIGYRTARRETFPGATSFARYAVSLGLFLAVFMALRFIAASIRGFNDGAPRWLVVLGLTTLLLLLVLTVLPPISWLRFVLEYTGQRVPTSPRTFAIIGLPVLVAVAGFLGLFVIGVGGVLLGVAGVGDLPIGAALDYILAFSVFYVAALLVAGSMLVGWTNYTYRHLPTRGGALLGIGAILPWAAVAIPQVGGFFVDRPLVFGIHAAVGGVVGAAAVGGAVTRYSIFEDIPTAGTVGRDVTVDEMNDPVVVVDDARQIIDLNPAADALLDTTYEAIGEPLSAHLEDDAAIESLLAGQASSRELSFGRRTVEATPSELVDDRGRTIGHSIVFHDVTERKRREQRIQVLNRVLRHNLRNDLNAVQGYAQLLEERTSDDDGFAREIQELASGLVAIGEKAREIEAVVAAEREPRSKPLSAIVDAAVEDVRSDYPECRIETGTIGVEERVNGPVLRSVLQELVENACRHTDAAAPKVTLDVNRDDDGITIRVADNGPGIPDHELTPLREGAETDLEHGSGLGLWLVDWGVTTLDGQVDFETNDPRGTVVTLRLPPAS